MPLSLADASHFLSQATLGADRAEVSRVAEMGIAAWINEQFAMPRQSYLRHTQGIWDYFAPRFIAKHGRARIVNDFSDPPLPYWFYWRMAWWDLTMKGKDQLRQRVAQALSQILVVSEKSELELNGFGLAGYFDTLYTHAIGNFRDMLLDVSLHPAMGVYLSHMFNQKGDPATNRRPDENYAREIMQLFSIGLFELNEDGTRKRDANGQDIPTYDNVDIQEMARVFTGLEPAEYYWPWDDRTPQVPVSWDPDHDLNQSRASVNLWKPMRMKERYHDTGEKRILKRKTLPAGQGGMKDIRDAVDVLFNHPNVGPFIGRQLIQRLVKSNPCPAYVERVSRAFADDGEGVRGNMRAVIAAILTDPEARQRDGSELRVREPLLRYTQFMRAFNASNASGRLWNYGYQFEERVHQSILAAPSVFNYYPPDYAPNGSIYDSGDAAPELKLHDTASSTGYVNLAGDWFFGGEVMEVFTEVDPQDVSIPHFLGPIKEEDKVRLNLARELELAKTPRRLVDHLDVLLAGGSLSSQTKSAMVEAITPLSGSPTEAVQFALMLTFIAPDYVVMS